MAMNDNLQALCRQYLYRLRYMADKHGLGRWVNDTIKANKRGECEGTRKEVDMLARLVADDRAKREEIPEILGKSYRQCVDDGTFDRIDKLPHTGIYSKVSALLMKMKSK